MVRRSRLTFDGSYSGKGRGHFAYVLDDFTEAGILQCYSNVDAEYEALMRGLRKAIQLGVSDLTIQGDSKTVLHQITGQMKARKTRDKLEACRVLLQSIPTYTLEWIPRRENIAHHYIRRDG